VLREEKTYLTCAGSVKVERSLYRGPDGDNICPLELQAGIIEGSWTPSAARMGYYVTALLSQGGIILYRNQHRKGLRF
jgi:hypothetical protein